METIKKNKEYVVDIIDNGIDGEGIAKIDNFTVFVPQTIKGEKVKILIVKVLTSYAYGKVIEILKASKDRLCIDCNTYLRCGGCSLRFMKYEKTLELKKELVKNCFKKAIKKDLEVCDTIGMEKPFYYRNKLQYPVGLNKNNQPVIGVFAKRTHDIIPTRICMIQNKKLQEIANDSFDFLIRNGVEPYNEKKQTGELRHIVVRIGVKTNEVMLILVINRHNIKNEVEFANYISNKHPEIKTIVKNINNKNTNVILGKENEVIFGDGYIYDILGKYKFKISPMSFYQINPIQTEILYNNAIENANLTKDDVILDLYCGIGTIGIFASQYVKKVYGIEIIENAIKDANENLKINNILNAEYLCGDVEKTLPIIIEKEKISPTVVFIDPPRKGCDSNTISNLKKIKPRKIIYISCNPATLARDVAMLNDVYEIKMVQPVDMFPYTSHVECVSLLTLKK